MMSFKYNAVVWEHH